ncbi:MAG: chromosomal replication initiator protein DnaA [Defluviitaleaceae bacterium]|nr:chromosomal replication initiator protein DnaA [Defluviitaleaceae bacterium]
MINKMELLWNETLLALNGQFTEVTYETIIKILKPVHMDNEAIYLTAPNVFIKNSVEKRYYNTVLNTFKSLAGENYNVIIILPEDEAKRENKTKSNLVSKYTFETFVKARSNDFAYATSIAVANEPGTEYNPLFLYGGVGLGKTHLMHAIGNFIKEQNPEMKVLYVSTETFTNELITSIQQMKNQEFRNKYRDTDVLLIDDIQFLQGKDSTQEEFFHTFNVLKDSNKQIVISSDKPPKDLKTLEERLTSRFAQGMIADLKLPDFETRMAILEKKAILESIHVPKEVQMFIADNFYSNIRELEGALIKIIAISKMDGKIDITLEMAKKALEHLSTKRKKVVDIPLIQRIVANYFNITTDDLTGKKRSKNIAYPRQIAMYLARKLIDMPLTSIGEAFGGRDHSTVIHSCEKIVDSVENNSEIKAIVLEIEKLITNGED